MLAIADLPPQLQEHVVCSITAAIKYQVPANIILAVAEKEAGKPGLWVRNSNGTHDVGPMQFNTAYLRELARYGITANDVAASGCYSFELAAWRLRRHILHDKGDLWTRAANYHSRTYKYNAVYRADLIRKAAKWANWLEAHYKTVDILNTPGTVTAVAQRTSKIKQVQQPANPTVQSSSRSLGRAGYVPRTITFNDRETGQ